MSIVLESSATAAVFTIPSRAAFNAAYPTAVLEDFEEANVNDGSSATMDPPLNSSTNNHIFSTGDIVDGLNITVPLPTSDNLFISSPAFANYVSHAVSFNLPTTPQPQITIELTNNDVRAVAFDLTSNPGGHDVTVELFSGVTSLGQFQVNDVLGAGTFFGAASDPDIITRVTLSNSNFFGFDNIAFAPIPEPSTFVLSLLFWSGLAGLRRRQRAETP